MAHKNTLPCASYPARSPAILRVCFNLRHHQLLRKNLRAKSTIAMDIYRDLVGVQLWYLYITRAHRIRIMSENMLFVYLLH